MLVSWSTFESQVKEAEAGSTHSGLATDKGALGSLVGLTLILGCIHEPIIACCHLAMNYSVDSPSFAYMLTMQLSDNGLVSSVHQPTLPMLT